MSAEDIVKNINANFADDAMIVKRAEWYTGNIKALRDNFEYVLYSLTVHNDDYSYGEISQRIADINAGAEFTLKLKVKSKTKRDAYETIEVNAKDYMYKCFCKKNDDDTWTLFAALSANLAIYDFAAALFKTAKRKLYKYPAVVEEYLLKTAAGSLDMFGSYCIHSGCDEQIEDSIWGEPISDTYCLEHKYLNTFVHRDTIDVVAGFSAEFEEEAENDEAPIDLGGHDDDDDDDTDLEEQVLAKSGNTGV